MTNKITKRELKNIIRETYQEIVADIAESKSDDAPTKKSKSKKKSPVDSPNKVTNKFIDNIKSREKSNKARGDTGDADLLNRLGGMLKKHVGRTLEEGDVEKMMNELNSNGENDVSEAKSDKKEDNGEKEEKCTDCLSKEKVDEVRKIINKHRR